MTLSEELKQICRNFIKDLNLFYEKIKLYPLISLLFIITVLLIVVLPHLQVSGINNVTEKVTQENQSRATLTQVLGGVAIGIGLYYTWRRINIAEEDLKITQENLKVTQENLEATQKAAQENLKVAQEGQITERFTRAIDQLGNPAIEIRLGGIYALERIANESEKDYWPIIEILTAYVRNNSSAEIVENKKIAHLVMDIQANESTKNTPAYLKKVSLDIQAILTVIGKRKKSFNEEPGCLNLQMTFLQEANLMYSNLEGADLYRANLEMAELRKANLEGADLMFASLKGAYLFMANLKEAKLHKANLEEAKLYRTNLKGAILFESSLEGAELFETILEGADLMEANFKGAKFMRTNLEGANLKRAEYLTVDQLSKAKTLYNAGLDPELEKPLREKYFHLFDKPKDEL